MRKWHRWLAVLFGLFLLWISVTGVLSQIGSLVNKGGFEGSASRSVEAAPAAPPGFQCPSTMTCRPKPKPGPWNVGLLHHLHSGESFGPAGPIVSILSGLALLFFSFSGLWMYIRMFRARLARARRAGTPRARLFWD